MVVGGLASSRAREVGGENEKKHKFRTVSSAFFLAAICDGLNCFSLTAARDAAAAAFASAAFSAACCEGGLGAIVRGFPCACAAPLSLCRKVDELIELIRK